MKKRLLSMLMAVLMIASLVPATALAAADTAAKDDPYGVNQKADATAKQPGITVKDDGKGGYDVTITPFAKIKDRCKPACTNLVTKELIKATCDQQGLTVYYCGTCGKQMMEPKTDPALKHDCEFTVVVAPTCENGGTAGWGYAVCKKCGVPTYVTYTRDNTAFEALIEKGDKESPTAYDKRVEAVKDQFKPLEHDYVEVTADVKNDDGDTIAYAAKAATHTEFATEGKLDGVWQIPAVDKKTGHFVSRFIGETGANRPENKNAATIEDKGWKAGTVCSVCGVVKDKKGAEEAALNTAHKAYIKVLEAGFLPYVDEDGEKVDGVTAKCYCTVCNKPFGGTVLPYDEFWSVEEVAEPKIGDSKTYEGEDVYQLVGNAIVKVDADKLNKATPATCQKVGNTGDVIVYTASGVADEETGKVPGVWMLSKKGEELKKLDHHFVALESKDATCTEDGAKYVGISKCDNVIGKDETTGKDIICGEYKLAKINNAKFNPDGSVDASQFVVKAKHGDSAEKVLVEATCQHTGLNVLVCSDCGAFLPDGDNNTYYTEKVDHAAAEELANVKEATCQEKGYTGDVVCKWCGEVMKKGTETDLGDHKFVNGKCEVCGAEDPDYVANPFKDLKETDRFYKEIIWAANEGIVKGDDKGNYNADATLTRAQVVTMLWRQAGEQKATKAADFSDLTQDWYKDAVAWAVENGITEGIGDGKFDPAGECTRAQFVTFLWRANNKPAATAAADFTDLTQGWYKDAVAWAVETGVTNGVGNGKFAPDEGCTRGQAAAFLYRLANPAK